MMIRRSKYEKSDLESLSSDANGSETKGEEAASRRRRGLCCCSAVTVLVCFFLWRWSLDGSLTTSHMSFRQKAGDTYWLVRSAHSRWTASSAVSVFPSSKQEAVVDFRASLEECAPVETALAMHLKVPKAASTTIFDLVYALSIENGFAVDSRPIYVNSEKIGRTKREYASYLSSFGSVKTIRTAHCPYVALGLFQQRPVYFGLVREPSKRLSSHYEYLHWGPRSKWATFWKGQNKEAPSFEACVSEKMKTNMQLPTPGDCLYWANAQLAYFCGLDCSPQAITANHDGPRALQKANRHVQEAFVAVGIVERLDDALFVFERVLPAFFANARARATGLVSRVNNNHRTKPKGLNSTIQTYLRDIVLPYEYRFYESLLTQFDTQFQACQRRQGLSSSDPLT